MKRVLMILTSHRLDCFRLTMEVLLHTGNLQKFDHVVLLLSGVVGKHKRYVEQLIARHPDIPWDTLEGPRGKGKFVAGPQNKVVERYPGALYFKMDEDIIVPPGWVDKLTAAWEHWCEDPTLGLITPLVANNATGAHYLLNNFPDLAAEYAQRFDHEITTQVDGPVWQYPDLAAWITRRHLDLAATNRVLEQRCEEGAPRYQRFAHRFSINNLVYDYAHWQALGGIPDDEEPAWTQWVVDQGRANVLVCDTLLHHYSFFVQQDWLDRTSLLEELRAANLPGTAFTGAPHRWRRVLRQLPRVLKRRLGVRS